MKRKFLSAVLSLSVMMTGVAPCFASESAMETTSSDDTANYSAADYQEMAEYCEKNSYYPVREIGAMLLIFFSVFGFRTAAAYANYKRALEPINKEIKKIK